MRNATALITYVAVLVVIVSIAAYAMIGLPGVAAAILGLVIGVVWVGISAARAAIRRRSRRAKT